MAAAAKSNLRRQSQTKGTTFRITPLIDESGYYADIKANVDAVLNGTYVSQPTTGKYAKEFPAALAMPDSIHQKGPIDLNVTPKQHK